MPPINNPQPGDQNAARVLHALAAAGDAGLSQTRLNRRAFSGHKRAAKLRSLLARLTHAGLIHKSVEPPAGGRPITIWSLTDLGRRTDPDLYSTAIPKETPMNANEPTPDPAMSIRAEASPSGAETPIAIFYRNHRGETAQRLVLPRRVHFGTSPWHPEPQWLLEAVDLAKGPRTFALRDALPIAAAIEEQDPAERPTHRPGWGLGDNPPPGFLRPAEDKARCSQAIPSTESPSQTIFEDVGGFVAHSVNGEVFLVFADGAVKLSKVVQLRRLTRVSEPSDYIEVLYDDGQVVTFDPWPRPEGGAAAPTAPRPREIVSTRVIGAKEVTIGDRVHFGGGPVMRVKAIEVDLHGQVQVACLYPRNDGTDMVRWVEPRKLMKLREETPDEPVKMGNKDNAAPSAPPLRDVVPVHDARGRAFTIGDHVHHPVGGPVFRVEGFGVNKDGEVQTHCRRGLRNGTEEDRWFTPGSLLKLNDDPPASSEGDQA